MEGDGITSQSSMSAARWKLKTWGLKQLLKRTLQYWPLYWSSELPFIFIFINMLATSGVSWHLKCAE